MQAMNGNSPPASPTRKRRSLSRWLMVIGVTVAVAMSVTFLALAAGGRLQSTTSAQSLATPLPTGTPWPMPTEPPLQHPSPVWLDPAGNPLAALAPATITARCTVDNFDLRVAPGAPAYPRDAAVVFTVSIVFTGPNPCVMQGTRIPVVGVHDSAGNPIWSVGGRHGDLLAQVASQQLPAAGDTLTEQFWWPQDECYFGHCPDTEAPSGTYTVQAFFPPYGNSQPATFQLGS